MPELQRTIDNCDLQALVPVSPMPSTGRAAEHGPPADRPTMLYCACGCEATADCAAGSVCDDCFTTDVECHGCNECCDPADMTEINDEQYCELCADEYSCCDSCGEHVHNDDSCSDNNGNTICESCYSENYFHCDGCEEGCHNDNIGRCNHCGDCWDNLGDDERADLIVEHEHGVYRNRPSAPSNPVVSNRPYSSSCCQPVAFNPLANSSARCGSYRTYGVELETSSCPGAVELSDRTVFQSKADGSIKGWEFNSAVLNGDAGLDEVEKFCELAEEHSFAVDSTCGFHAHFGVGDLSDEQRYNVALSYYFTESVWTAFVSQARRDTNFCAPIKWKPIIYRGTVGRIEYSKDAVHHDFDISEDGDSFTQFANVVDRYYWFNVNAFTNCETFEIRLHSGTISAKKINHWVVAHLRFIEFVQNLSRESIVREFHNKTPRQLFSALLELLPADTATYLTERAAQFGTTFTADTTQTAPAELATA